MSPDASLSPMTGIIETLAVPNPVSDVFGRAQLVVQFFADESQRHAAEKASQQAHADIHNPAGSAGLVGNQRRIHDANVGRLRGGRDPGLFDLGIERVVEVHIGLNFLLERGVSGHLAHFFGGALHFRGHQTFARLGCRIAGPHRVHDGMLLTVQLALQFVHLALQLLAPQDDLLP